MPSSGGALKVVWLLGFAALLALSVRQHRKLSRWAGLQPPVTNDRVMELLRSCKARLNVTCEIKVVTTTLLTTPAVFRFRKPYLLVPTGMLERLDDRELTMIFLHELVHIRHCDILLNWTAIIVRSLHWFNPLVWLAVRRLRADQELVCDARVVCLLAADERRLYGNTLIKLLDDFSEAGLCPSLVPVINSKREIKRRITMIAKFRPTTRAALICFVWFVVALCCFTFTGAADKELSQERPERAKARADSIKEEAFQGLRQLGREVARLDNEIKSTQTKLDSLREELAIPNDFSVTVPAPPIEPEMLRRLEAVRIEAHSLSAKWGTLYQQLKNLPRDELVKAMPTAFPDPLLAELLSKQAMAEQQLTTSRKDLTDENIEVRRLNGLHETITKQIEARLDGVLQGLKTQLAMAEAQYRDVDEQIHAIKIKEAEKEKEQKKYDPYVAMKRNLETQKMRRQAMMMKLAAEAIDVFVPKDEFSEQK